MVQGWCDVEEGRVDDGLAALRHAFREYGATAQRIAATTFSVLFAEAHLDRVMPPMPSRWWTLRAPSRPRRANALRA